MLVRTLVRRASVAMMHLTWYHPLAHPRVEHNRLRYHADVSPVQGIMLVCRFHTQSQVLPAILSAPYLPSTSQRKQGDTFCGSLTHGTIGSVFVEVRNKF